MLKLDVYKNDLFFIFDRKIHLIHNDQCHSSHEVKDLSDHFIRCVFVCLFFVSITLSSGYIYTFLNLNVEKLEHSREKNHLLNLGKSCHVMHNFLFIYFYFLFFGTASCKKMNVSPYICVPMILPHRTKHPILSSFLVELCSQENILYTVFCVADCGYTRFALR